jgi:DNA-binding CsgD family transcriptional regulator
MTNIRALPRTRGADTCRRRVASYLGKDWGEFNTCSAANSGLESDRAREFGNAPDDRSHTTRSLLAGLEALDLLHIGWLVCDAAGRVLDTNRTADDILKTRDGLELNPNGALCALHGCSQPLDKAVQRAARATRSMERARRNVVLTVQRICGKRGLTLFIRSVPGVSTINGSRRSVALVLILDSALPVRTTDTDLYELYRLTPAESRLATLLMEGRTLRHCCHELGFSSSTARTHLKCIFKKARVHHQSELISVLFKSIGLGRLGNQEPFIPSVGVTGEHQAHSIDSPCEDVL